MGFGFSRLCRPAIQFADREQALGPEVIGLGLQGFVEMPFGLKQIAAFVALEATQEVVECAVRVDLLGRRSLFLCPVEIAGPLQAGLRVSSGKHEWAGGKAASRVQESGAQSRACPEAVSPGRGSAMASASTINIS